jgi:hypothetical protein
VIRRRRKDLTEKINQAVHGGKKARSPRRRTVPFSAAGFEDEGWEDARLTTVGPLPRFLDPAAGFLLGGLPPLGFFPLLGLALLLFQPPLLPLSLFQPPLLVVDAALVVLLPLLVGSPPFLLALVGPPPLLVRPAAPVLLQLALAAPVQVVNALAFQVAALLFGPALFVRLPALLGLALGLLALGFAALGFLPLPGVRSAAFGLAALRLLLLPGVVSTALGLAALGFRPLPRLVSAPFGLAALRLLPLPGLVSPPGVVPVRLDQPGQHQAQNRRPHKPPTDSFPVHRIAFLLAVAFLGLGQDA